MKYFVKHIKRYLLPCVLLLALANTVFSQVEINNKIILTDTNSNNRNVFGTTRPIDGNDAVNLASFSSGELQFAIATGSNNNFDLTTKLPFQVVEGAFLYFFAPDSISFGEVKIRINNTAWYNVKKNVNQDFNSGELVPNQLVKVIFDGTNFQLLSEPNKICKPGFVNINNRYCVDQHQRDTSNFYNAVKSCGDNNAILCNWNQWYTACLNANTNGSTGYLSCFEWIDDAGNTTIQAKAAGYNENTAFNGYGCGKNTTINPGSTTVNSASQTNGLTIAIRFRCCYKL